MDFLTGRRFKPERQTASVDTVSLAMRNGHKERSDSEQKQNETKNEQYAHRGIVCEKKSREGTGNGAY